VARIARQQIEIDDELVVDVSPPKARRDPRRGPPTPAQRRYAKSLGLDPDRYDASSISEAIEFEEGQSPADPEGLESMRPGSLVLPRPITEHEATAIQEALDSYELWCPACKVPCCYEDPKCGLCNRPFWLRVRVSLVGVDGVPVPRELAQSGHRWLSRHGARLREVEAPRARSKAARSVLALAILATGVALVFWLTDVLGAHHPSAVALTDAGSHAGLPIPAPQGPEPPQTLQAASHVSEAMTAEDETEPAVAPEPEAELEPEPELEPDDTPASVVAAEHDADRWAEELRQQTPRLQFIQAAIKSEVVAEVALKQPVTTIWVGKHWTTVDDRTREMICRAASDFARTDYRCGFVAVSVRDSGLGREIARYDERDGVEPRLLVK
jgi:hypothetical protein